MIAGLSFEAPTHTTMEEEDISYSTMWTTHANNEKEKNEKSMEVVGLQL